MKKTKRIYESEELRVLAEDIIKRHDLFIGPAKIGYLFVEPEISKRTAGLCRKSDAELKMYSSYDYLIQISKSVWEEINTSTQEVLLLHELMHVDVREEKDEESGEVTHKFKIRPHDVQDFQSLLEKHGINWLSDLQDETAKLHGLDRDKVKIKL